MRAIEISKNRKLKYVSSPERANSHRYARTVGRLATAAWEVHVLDMSWHNVGKKGSDYALSGKRELLPSRCQSFSINHQLRCCIHRWSEWKFLHRCEWESTKVSSLVLLGLFVSIIVGGRHGRDSRSRVKVPAYMTPLRIETKLNYTLERASRSRCDSFLSLLRCKTPKCEERFDR